LIKIKFSINLFSGDGNYADRKISFLSQRKRENDKLEGKLIDIAFVSADPRLKNTSIWLEDILFNLLSFEAQN
jgi:hypothetical protein